MIAILYKMGLFKFLTERKTTNGEARRNVDLGARLDTIEGNHLHTIQSSLDKQGDDISEIKNTLKNFEQFGIKIRKR